MVKAVKASTKTKPSLSNKMARSRSSKKARSRSSKKARSRSSKKVRSRSSKKARSRTSKKLRSLSKIPQSYFRSEETIFTSHPSSGEPYGKRTTIDMKNNIGEKSIQILNSKGNPIRTSKTTLKKPNIKPIRIHFTNPGLFEAFAF